MLLSDEDIKKELQDSKEIIIEPFEENSLTPIGYDLRVGEKWFYWKRKCIFEIKNDNSIKIERNDTVVIETYESVQLSKRFGATIHSMATQVIRRGLSHISTTIDPGWTGKMLISLHNNLDRDIELKFKENFCTVCFYQLRSEAKKDIGKSPGRTDIWAELSDISTETIRRRASTKVIYTIVFLVLSFFIYCQYPTLWSWVQKFLEFIFKEVKLLS